MHKGRIAAAWNTLNRNKGEGGQETSYLKKKLGELKPTGEEVKPEVKPAGEEVKPAGEEVKPAGEEVKPTGDEVTVGAETGGEGKIRSESGGNPGSGGKKDGGDGKSDPTEGGEGSSYLKKLGEFWYGKDIGEDGKHTGGGSGEKKNTGGGGDKKDDGKDPMAEVLKAASNLMLASAAFDTAMKAVGAAVWIERKGFDEGSRDLGKATIGLDSKEDSANIKDLMSAVRVINRKLDDANWKLDLLLPQDAPKRPKPTPPTPPTEEQPTLSGDGLQSTPSDESDGDAPSFEDVC